LLPPLVQLLPALGHERLALAGGELVVDVKAGSQLLETGRHHHSGLRFA
jgi:hypothetical protein